jgi:hypothetical protein
MLDIAYAWGIFSIGVDDVMGVIYITSLGGSYCTDIF